MSIAREQLKLSIELHVIQSFAPSNLNRDDVGYPKETFFGGYRRARVSSQAWKYAIRNSDTFWGYSRTAHEHPYKTTDPSHHRGLSA